MENLGGASAGCGTMTSVSPRILIPPTLTHSPFTIREGQDAGLTRGRLRGRDLHAPYHGVRTATPAITLDELALAYQKRASSRVFFCSLTAARLMGVPLPRRFEESRELHVAVRSPSRAPRAAGIVGHRYIIDEQDIHSWRGLRLTTPERTWCDLASVLSFRDLVAAGDFLIHWKQPVTSRERLENALLRHRGRRGRGKCFRALHMLNERSESRRESILRLILVEGRIAGLEVNLEIRTSGGFKYRGDLAVPRRKTIIEYQSRFHEQPEDFRRDMTRISRLEADGWCVIQVNGDDLNDPLELLERVRRVLSSRPLHP